MLRIKFKNKKNIILIYFYIKNILKINPIITLNILIVYNLIALPKIT
jgi:hypothetical protein